VGFFLRWEKGQKHPTLEQPIETPVKEKMVVNKEESKSFLIGVQDSQLAGWLTANINPWRN